MSKINSLIQELVSEIINKELAEDIQFLTINFVDTAKDLSESFVYVHFAQGDQGEQLEQLNEKKYIIQKIFAKKINLRRTPRLYFVLDTKQDKVNKIEKILKDIATQ